ncbi:hypothetical protein LguiA_024741 [Lonicera macranthoides]
MPPVDHACRIKKKDMTTELYSLWGGKRKGGIGRKSWKEEILRNGNFRIFNSRKPKPVNGLYSQVKNFVILFCSKPQKMGSHPETLTFSQI